MVGRKKKKKDQMENTVRAIQQHEQKLHAGFSVFCLFAASRVFGEEWCSVSASTAHRAAADHITAC